MGTSTNGILAYGYDLQGLGEGMRFKDLAEYDVPDWIRDADEDTGWKDFEYAAERRLLDAHGFTETWETRVTEEGYFSREQAAKTAMGVQIESHCSSEYSMFLLAAKVMIARRGFPETIDFTLPDDADERLAWAVEVLGLDVGDQKPRWLLASYWG